MLRTKRDKRIDLVLAGTVPKGFPTNLMRATIVKLLMLDAAQSLAALRSPPGNRLEALEALEGDRQGQYSIRINQQWRLCFVWREGDAHDVEIVDYH